MVTNVMGMTEYSEGIPCFNNMPYIFNFAQYFDLPKYRTL